MKPPTTRGRRGTKSSMAFPRTANGSNEQGKNRIEKESFVARSGTFHEEIQKGERQVVCHFANWRGGLAKELRFINSLIWRKLRQPSNVFATRTRSWK